MNVNVLIATFAFVAVISGSPDPDASPDHLAAPDNLRHNNDNSGENDNCCTDGMSCLGFCSHNTCHGVCVGIGK
jgi:hypothetical protein